MMIRHHDWPERLAAFVEARRARAFSWGQQDCALFAADAVLEMTGTDLADGLRGYRSAAGAAKRIEAAGGMRELALSRLPEKHPGLAQRGDVVLVQVDGRESFGVVLGGVWCGPGIDGLVFRPMTEVIAAFEV